MTTKAPAQAGSSPPVRVYCVAAHLPQAVRQGCLPVREEHGFFSNGPALAQWCATLARPSALLAAKDVDVPVFAHPEGLPLPVQSVAALQDRAYGTWHGLALRDIPAEKLAAFLHDTEFTPPEGESARQFQARIAEWAEGGNLHGTVVLLAHPAVVRAMAVHVLGGNSALTHKLDCAPGSLSLFTRQGGHWRIRMVGAPFPPET